MNLNKVIKLVVRIVGTKLDEIEYFARDVQVKVLRKGKRKLKNMIDFDFRNNEGEEFITKNNIITLKEDLDNKVLKKTIDLGKNYKYYRLNMNYKLLDSNENKEKTIKITLII